MIFNFLLLVSSIICSVHPLNRVVVSTGTRDVVSMWQLDPHEKTLPHLDDIRRQIYDTLYEIDDRGSTKESLVDNCSIPTYDEDIENNVKIIIDCSLKHNVFFHDGIELTAKDVEYSINRLKRSKTQSSSFDIMESCVAKNKYELVFTLKYKTPDVMSSKEWLYERFKRILATVGYITRARYMEGNLNWAIEYPVGTGPFYFEDWKIWDKTNGRSQIVLSKNKSYWKKTYPRIDQLIFRFLPSDMWMSEFKQENLSLVLRPTVKDYQLFYAQNKGRGIAGISKRLRYSYQYLLFNPSSTIMGSKELQRILLRSISREKLSKSLGSTVMVNSGRALYSSCVFPEKFPVLKYQPRTANDALLNYLDERGENGNLKISILVPDRAEELLVVEELRRQLYTVGFTLKIKKMSSENYNIAVNNNYFSGYDLILYSVEENPNYLTPKGREILDYGGMQLYQRMLAYILSRPDIENTSKPFSVSLSRFTPPAEGAVRFFDAE